MNIRLKITLMTLFAICVLFCTYLFIVNNAYKKEFNQVLLLNATTIAYDLKNRADKIISLGLELNGLLDFQKQCQEIVNKNNNIAYAMIIDANGEILFHNDIALQKDTIPLAHDVINAVKIAGNYNRSIKIKNEANEEIYVPIFNNNVLQGAVCVAFPMRVIEQKIRSLTTYTIAVSFFVLIIIMGIIWLSLQKLMKPLYIVVEMLKDIAKGEGDLTKRISISSSDEFGKLSEWFNTFTEKLQKIIIHAIDNSTKAVKASEELDNVSGHITARTNEVSTQFSAMASAAQHGTKAISIISSNATGMSTAVASVAASIEKMNMSLNEVARNCQKESEAANHANSQTQSTRIKMEKLDIASKQIGRIVEVISDIAEQTNMLALNATIEATSAGEAGKGFAVVATEVKELAQQTAKATMEIDEQVTQMQSITNEMILAMENISKIVTEVNDISQVVNTTVTGLSSTTSDIAININNASNAASTIAKNVENTAHELTEVSLNIDGVSIVTTDVAQGITQMNKSISRVKLLLDELHSTVGQFKV